MNAGEGDLSSKSCHAAVLVNKLVPCSWLSSRALEFWRLKLQLANYSIEMYSVMKDLDTS